MYLLYKYKVGDVHVSNGGVCTSNLRLMIPKKYDRDFLPHPTLFAIHLLNFMVSDIKARWTHPAILRQSGFFNWQTILNALSNFKTKPPRSLFKNIESEAGECVRCHEKR